MQVAEFQPVDTIKSISHVLFKHFIQKRDVALPRRSFTSNLRKLIMNNLVYKEAARCQLGS